MKRFVWTREAVEDFTNDMGQILQEGWMCISGEIKWSDRGKNVLVYSLLGFPSSWSQGITVHLVSPASHLGVAFQLHLSLPFCSISYLLTLNLLPFCPPQCCLPSLNHWHFSLGSGVASWLVFGFSAFTYAHTSCQEGSVWPHVILAHD